MTKRLFLPKPTKYTEQTCSKIPVIEVTRTLYNITKQASSQAYRITNLLERKEMANEAYLCAWDFMVRCDSHEMLYLLSSVFMCHSPTSANRQKYKPPSNMTFIPNIIWP